MVSIITPDWVKDAVFYQIFPDRFARSDAVPKPSNLERWDDPPTRRGFKGGDLLGVVERLDYLQDLGVTAIYFNPIFQSAANHRYHTHDYYHVDPILGGDAAFRHLLDTAHERGIRIILDGVFNHASRGFYQFHHLMENEADSPYVDWFQVKGFPLHAYDERKPPNYMAWWNLHALPKLNTNTPAVRQFLWDVGRHWIELGADGWRLDVPGEIDDDEFWREFRRQVKEANPEAYVVGEIWGDATRWLQGDQFDATMNYLFAKACLGFFIRDADRGLLSGVGYSPVPTLEVAEFAVTIEKILALYEREVTEAQLNVLDSHDTARFLTIAKGDESAFRLATLFQMTYPGAPCIYYGDEIGMQGRKDPDCRRAFPWDESRWNAGLRDFVKRCIALRHAHPALRRGDYTRLHARDEVYAFGRRLNSETLIIALNNGLSEATVDIDVAGYLPDGALMVDVWGEAVATAEDGELPLSIPMRSGCVMRVA
ncbi:MAG: glycoside hydrolase family 13 protein [Anaerolineae bacterium]